MSWKDWSYVKRSLLINGMALALPLIIFLFFMVRDYPCKDMSCGIAQAITLSITFWVLIIGLISTLICWYFDRRKGVAQ